jgi:hypothetical protein
MGNERDAVFGWDAARLRAGADVPASPTHPAAAALSARLWLAVLEGGSVEADALAALGRAADGARDAVRTVEAAVLRALAAESASPPEEFAALARTACRMAQAEESPDEEILAHLVLARARRLHRRPHLALHVLLALGQVAPADRLAWLAWETLLAGGAAEALQLVSRPGVEPSPAAALVRASAALLAAARAGDRPGFARAHREQLAALPARPAFAAEALGLAALLDPTLAAAEPVERFRRGLDDDLPHGLHGLALEEDGPAQAEGVLAYVHASPDGPGARLIAPGRPLLDTPRLPPAEDDAGGGPRTETGLATLALAGPAGLDLDAFFRAVYHFAYHPDRHRPMLHTLTSRMRNRLGDRGGVEREGEDGRIRLRLRSPLLVADARVTLPAATRVLRALIALGGAGAQETAKALGLPLRTVQRLFKDLVEDRALKVVKDGARVVYKVEDTVFTSLSLRPPSP